MEQHCWPEVQTLVEEALRLDQSDRAKFLTRIEDPRLRAEVEMRLSAEGDSTRLDTEKLSSGADFAALGFNRNSVIGPYRLLELIGKGGMGEVWLAEQKAPVRRRVALKLIKPGMDTTEVLRRFASEFQALALMDHPGIARIFESGFTPQGRPFFAMEYVPGAAITDYCDQHRLTIQERLELFCRVCDAVQHAHQKAIIHRDLKPSNILVSEVDGRPVPKIIDFGLAKALGQQLTPDTIYTTMGAVMGTPGYMSPEQAFSTQADIDTRTDVYSLGVILYELLVGVRPVEYTDLPLTEIARIQSTQQAAPPSSKLQSLQIAKSTLIANYRRLDPKTLRRRLRRDLDAITLKAVERERTRRYASASEFAADIARYLRDEPIEARPASFFYRAQKTLVRNKGLSLSVAGVIIAILAISFVEAVQLKRITEQRNRADSTLEFIVGMFKVPDHGMGPGVSITAEEILNTALHQIQTSYPQDPLLEGRLEDALAEIYNNLGGPIERARELARDSVRILTKADGPDGRETLRARRTLAQVLWSDDDARARNDAEGILREAIKADRRVLGSRNPETLRAIERLGLMRYSDERIARKTDFNEPESLLEEASAGEAAVLGADNRTTLATKLHLVQVLQTDRKYARAEELCRQLVDIARKGSSADNAALTPALHALAITLDQEDKLPEAEQVGREWMAREAQQGSQDLLTAFSANRFVLHVLTREQKYAAAEAEGEQLLDLERKTFGPNHHRVGVTLYNLACIAARSGQHEKALSLLTEAFAHGLGRDDVKLLESDPDTASIRADPRFRAVLAKAK